MKKRKFVLSCLASLIIITVSVFLVKMIVKLSGSGDDQDNRRDSVAIYIDESVGDGYVLSSSKTFPGMGYSLDLDKSECTNGAIVTSGEDKSVDLSYGSASECKLYFYRVVQESLASKILSKANAASVSSYTSGKTGEVYTFSHSVTDSTGALTDYRYIGANPNNYVKFNDEIWRIIGLFNDSGELKVKLIRNETIGQLQWNNTYSTAWEGNYLYNILNSGSYYNRTGTHASTGLNSVARSQLSEVTWYLGGTDSYVNKVAEDYYNFERGSVTCYSLGLCTNDRSITTRGKVGLFYPSDYIFTFGKGVENTCFNSPRYCENGFPTTSWMWNIMNIESDTFKWGITPFSTETYPEEAAYVIDQYGNAAPATSIISPMWIYPVLYLRGDLWTLDGNGSKGDPYILEIPTYSLTNDDWSFVYDAANQRFANNNQNQNSTTASTVVLFNTAITNGIRLDWTVNSEASWDKFTLKHNAVVLVNGESGANKSGSYEIPNINMGDSLTFEYAKDSSQSSNGDTATVRIVQNPSVMNDPTYYFVYDSETGVYTSNNQNHNSTVARTRITFHESKTVVVEWTVNSEASYDKFRILKNGVQFLADQSGAGQAGNTFIPVVPGDVLTFEYDKDFSQSENGDTAGFMIS